MVEAKGHMHTGSPKAEHGEILLYLFSSPVLYLLEFYQKPNKQQSELFWSSFPDFFPFVHGDADVYWNG